MNSATITESLVREIVRLVATSPAGQGLLLIGGTRYRLLDRSHRLSTDADYHWDGFHARSITRILDTQVDPDAASNMKLAGGGEMVVDEVIRILMGLLPPAARK